MSGHQMSKAKISRMTMDLRGGAKQKTSQRISKRLLAAVDMVIEEVSAKSERDIDRTRVITHALALYIANHHPEIAEKVLNEEMKDESLEFDGLNSDAVDEIAA